MSYILLYVVFSGWSSWPKKPRIRNLEKILYYVLRSCRTDNYEKWFEATSWTRIFFSFLQIFFCHIWQKNEENPWSTCLQPITQCCSFQNPKSEFRISSTRIHRPSLVLMRWWRSFLLFDFKFILENYRWMMIAWGFNQRTAAYYSKTWPCCISSVDWGVILIAISRFSFIPNPRENPTVS